MKAIGIKLAAITLALMLVASVAVSQSAAGRGHIDLQENPSQGNETDAKRAARTAESPPRRSTSQRYLLRDDISALAPCDVVQCHLIIVGRKPRLTN